jgi:HEAT repeat protein
MTEPTYEDYLIFLTDPDPDVRRNAAWWLGRQRDFRAIEPLIDALGDPDGDVRLRVAESLGNLRDEQTVEPLVTALEDDSGLVRAKAALALGNQGDGRAVPGLIGRLGDDEAAVRSAAAEALGLLPDSRAIEPLVDVVVGDANPDVRHYASRSLDRIGGSRTVDALLAALEQRDPDASARMYIAEVLAGLYDKRAVDPLRTLAESDEDEGVRATAEWALKQLGAG